MKNWLFWLLPVGVIAYFLLQRKPAPKPTVTNTGTANTAPDPFWKGWGNSSDRTLQNTTATIAQYQDEILSLSKGVSGWYGGTSTATGSASDVTTAGSGAGVPVDQSGNPDAFDSNQYFW